MLDTIKGIILDIDGVIVGSKKGVNSPDPHPDVIKRLKQIKEGGIPISLCTAKPYFAIEKIVREANLDNVHIVNGGGAIMNPITGKIVKTHSIDQTILRSILEMLLKEDVYTELYTVEDYYIQKSQYRHITDKHTHVLQREPKVVESLLDEISSLKVVRILAVTEDREDRYIFEDKFKPFTDSLNLGWGVHPVILPLQFGGITPKGISKSHGAVEIAENFGVSLNDMLGVGDSKRDWEFIGQCGYGAAMGNASQALKDLVLTKEKSRSYIGGDVDENGILEILDYFI
ncbi:MAG: HAD family hydrolase [bacterium]